MLDWILDNWVLLLGFLFTFLLAIVVIIILFFLKQMPWIVKIITGIISIREKREKIPYIVTFSAFSPQNVLRGSEFILYIWAHLASQYNHILSLAKEFKHDKKIGQKSGILIEKKTELTIEIEISSLKISRLIDIIFWSGTSVNACFIVRVTADAEIRSHLGTAFIRCEGLLIATLYFSISVALTENNYYTSQSEDLKMPKSAFASYSRKDSVEVLQRLQGMKAVAKSLDIFYDVESIRTGENWKRVLSEHVLSKDVFYLFWSRNASKSEWVGREWKLALETRGSEYIDPVPLESPHLAPPPNELTDLNFEDKYLAYMEYARSKKINEQI